MKSASRCVPKASRGGPVPRHRSGAYAAKSSARTLVVAAPSADRHPVNPDRLAAGANVRVCGTTRIRSVASVVSLALVSADGPPSAIGDDSDAILLWCGV